MQENLGRCLEQYSPLMAWSLHPNDQGILVRRQSIRRKDVLLTPKAETLVLCWVLAYAYEACVLHPGRGNRISGSKEKQMDAAADSEIQP